MAKSFDIIKVFKSISLSVLANLVVTCASIVTTLILPKFIPVDQYGYWQLYLFYTTYVGLFHLGINDGIYLRYGGQDYTKLDFGLMQAMLKCLAIIQFVIALVIIAIVNIFSYRSNLTIIYSLICCMILTNIRYFFIYLLQATNRIKEFALVTVIDKIIFIVLFLILLLQKQSAVAVIIADLSGRLVSLIISAYYCKELLFSYNDYDSFKIKSELESNVICGSKLLLANLASSCIIGIMRYGIQRQWDIETFGKISLMLSISNFFVIFINAVGVVLYPLLKRFDNEEKQLVFKNINLLFSDLLIFSLVMYYPIVGFVKWWLPQYSDYLQYILLLYPLYIFEGKTSLLYNTYLKVYRKERIIFAVNIICVVLSIMVTFINAIYMKNLFFMVLSIFTLLGIRCYSELIYIELYLKDLSITQHFCEILILILFVVINSILQDQTACILTVIIIALYQLFQKQYIHKAILNLKKMI